MHRRGGVAVRKQLVHRRCQVFAADLISGAKSDHTTLAQCGTG
jgi:hypothetical protein